MIMGDIRDKEIFNKILTSAIQKKAKLLLITPPCQGFSIAGKNKNEKQTLADESNFLIFKAIELIDKHDFDYILIENVPRFIKVSFPYRGSFKTLTEILVDKYSTEYTIESNILNAKDYGVPQDRPRAIIKLYKKKHFWPWPTKKKEITLRETISHLPSLESGEKSPIKWHEARVHSENHVKWMSHTPIGQSALDNPKHYPQKDKEKIKGFHTTYRRMSWDKPAPTRTTNSANISSYNNVHPGNPKPDGTYSDARTLTIYELLIVSSLPTNWNIPNWANEVLIRKVIGEGVPPLLMKSILGVINNHE